MVGTGQAAPGQLLRIEGPQTIADIERELADVDRLRPSHVLLPVRPKKWWFGGEASLIQLLISWGRRQPEATLVTHVGADEDPGTQLRHLVRRPFGLVAAWMARDVTDRPGTRAIKAAANAASEEVIDLMWHGRRAPGAAERPSLWGEDDEAEAGVVAVGDRVFLASIDHHPRWRIPPCYFPTGDVRHRDDFVALARSMAEKATSGRGGSPVTAEVSAPLGAILHELVKNTHEWARTDEHGVPLLRSVRGLLAQGHSWAEAQVADVASGSRPLATYLAHPQLRSAEGRWRFLELSVFDSGPGLARRWLMTRPQSAADRDHPTLEEEYRACHECFLRWNSSSGAGHKGLGLYEVLQMLSQVGAFFRVRTGRLSLYRDFLERPYAGAATGGGWSLADWSSGTDALTALAPAEGVLYTMLIPIRSRAS